MTTPAGWTSQGSNIYENKTFQVDSVNYTMKVNTQTGAMDLYVQNSLGDALFARSDAGNNLTFNPNKKNDFITSLPSENKKGLTSETAIATYLATKFSLPANQYRANLIKSVVPNASSTFTTMPGVGATQGPSPVATPTVPQSTAGSGNIAQTAQGIIDTAKAILQDPFAGAEAIDFNSSNDEIFKTFLLTYPQDLLTTEQDTLVIEQFRYRPPNQQFLTSQGLSSIVTDGLSRVQDLKDPLGTVILPIPQGIMDSNNVEWGGDNMSNLPAAAVSSVAQNLPTYAGLGLLGAAIGTAAGVGNLGGLGVKGAFYSQFLPQVQKSKELQAMFGAGAVSTVAGVAGYEVSPESLLSRGFGIAPNSNLELLFNGPTLRDFTFSYRMSPRSEKESKAIRNIIRFFKQGMAPRKQKSVSGSTGSFFLGTPNIFRLKYTYNGKNNIKGLNRFKNCALVGFSVNYAPDGQWASYGGDSPGQPVSLIVTMRFNELDPVYNTDYNATSNDEVGF